MAEIEVPSYFLCPITLEITKDPVTISTGITYDRDSIERWLFYHKNNTCPVTKQILSDKELTPNITLRRLIQSWCTINSSYGVQRLPTPKSPISKYQILRILNDAIVPQMQMTCLMKLKSIALENQTNRRTMESARVHEFLSSLIVKKTVEEATEDLTEQSRVSDEALSVLCSLQLSESGLECLNNSKFVEELTRVMQSGSYEARVYAITLMNSIFEVADFDQLNEPCLEFFIQLTRILRDKISQNASKAALKVLCIACPLKRNRFKAVEAGAVPLLIDLLLENSGKRTCEMILLVLDILCQIAEGRAELLKHGAGLAIVSKKILRVSVGASERAVKILHLISKFFRNFAGDVTDWCCD